MAGDVLESAIMADGEVPTPWPCFSIAGLADTPASDFAEFQPATLSNTNVEIRQASGSSRMMPATTKTLIQRPHGSERPRVLCSAMSPPFC